MGRHCELEVFVIVTLLAGPALAATLRVGPGQTYAAPCAAFQAAADGDTVEIDSTGSYAGDVCAITKSRLTIRGTGTNRAHIDAAGKNAAGKGIWVVQGSDTTIENVEFSGATVPDDNGAGIRQEGKNLTVRGCSFHDNQNGILAGDVAGSEILIEHSEFDHNGAGDGYSHNLYINHVAKLVFQYNYSHRAVVGHLLKTRAAENHILYNRLSGESDGSQSYEIDCPNGGLTYVIGNLVEQGASTQNPAILAYFEEGAHALNPSDQLYVVNNSFVNDLGRGTFVNVGSGAATPAVLVNNVFFGGGTLCSQTSASLSHNYDGKASCFVDAAALDLHLVSGSPCVDAGVDPGVGATVSLSPKFQYVHPAGAEPRPTAGTLDVGAFELAPSSPSGGAPTSGGRPSAGNTGTSASGATASGGAPASGGRQGAGNAGTSASGASASGGAPASGGRQGAGNAGAPASGGHETGGTAGALTGAGMSGDGSAPAPASENGCGCRLHDGGEATAHWQYLSALGMLATAFALRRSRRSR
ncbi:MAG TPA: right-handed parallel beta-helix repeat-containing protein [Polyangiaceae bacterium]|nr:right-handed parallel beta-helix repeat-containing protein [Polyangiaceae bacterium]